MKLLFERSRSGRGSDLLPACDVPAVSFDETLLRGTAPRLPEIAEVDLGRHYTELAKQTHGVNDGFYPLGSCTMKYNPRVNEEAAALPGFTQLHPLQPLESVQGALEVLHTAEKLLCEITGMDGMSFQPAAGAHGEYTGLLLIRKYHQSRGDSARTKILVPDSGPDTAGLMLTNPNTVGLFDANILEITRIVHEAGGLCYYDGANLNAIMGQARPGDMGFDCVHLNLHKTFSTPHGGGGPGSGPVGCKAALEPFLPAPRVRETEGGYTLYTPEETMGQVRSFYGNFLVVVKALAYLLTLGREGIPEASAGAVLNANYLMRKLAGAYTMSYDTPCMHEFVMTLEGLAHDSGVTAMDVAKRLLYFGIHPPTMYFPLIVHEALMVEPTETESPETLDQAAEVFLKILEEAKADPEGLHQAPHHCPIGRPDEVTAARNPILRYHFEG